MSQEYDIIILGGGPGGMTSALYAAKANLKCLIVETNICGGLVNSTYVIENFPTYPSINGMTLMEKFQEQLLALGVTIEEVAEIEGLQLEDKKKVVVTDTDTYIGKAVIISTGRTPIPLELEQEVEQVHYCAICDGTAYKGKDVMVIGGGNSGFDEALYLLTLGVNKLTLIEQMDRFFAAESIQNELLAYNNVNAMHSTALKNCRCEDGRLKEAVLAAGQEEIRLPVDGIFVFMGQKPSTEMFKGLISLDEQGYIVTDENMATSIPGVFAAGDVRQKQFRQVTTAMSDGTIATLSAERYLRSL